MQGLRPLYRYAEFSGRSGRAEFWQFVGLYAVALLLGILIDLALGDRVPVATLLVIAGLIVPGWAVTFRRLHDRGYSGWWYGGQMAITVLGLLVTRAANLNAYTATGDVLHVISLVVLAAQAIISIFLLVQLVQAGSPSDNRFGPAPRYEEPAPTFGDIALKVRAQAQPSTHPTTQPKSITPSMTPATPVPPVRAAASDVDPVAQIERLAKLRDGGMLTDEEFQAQKASLLARL